MGEASDKGRDRKLPRLLRARHVFPNLDCDPVPESKKMRYAVTNTLQQAMIVDNLREEDVAFSDTAQF
jgi:hypothetical protein